MCARPFAPPPSSAKPILGRAAVAGGAWANAGRAISIIVIKPVLFMNPPARNRENTRLRRDKRLQSINQAIASRRIDISTMAKFVALAAASRPDACRVQHRVPRAGRYRRAGWLEPRSRQAFATAGWRMDRQCLVIQLGHYDEHSAVGKKRHVFEEHGTSSSSASALAFTSATCVVSWEKD